MTLGLQFKLFMKEIGFASRFDRGFSLLGVSLGFGCVYATWYTYYLAVKGPEVNYLRGSNGDPHERYPPTYQQKWFNHGELGVQPKERAGPEEAWEAIGMKKK